MNHDCNGDVFLRWGKRFGRCFLDSSFFDYEDGIEFCPNCKRPWEGVSVDERDPKRKHSYDPDDDTDVLLNIDLPHFRRLAQERERKIKLLEDKLETWQKMYYEARGMKYMASLYQPSGSRKPSKVSEMTKLEERYWILVEIPPEKRTPKQVKELTKIARKLRGPLPPPTGPLKDLMEKHGMT